MINTENKIDFIQYTGKGIKISVVDSGVSPNHPLMRTNIVGGIGIELKNGEVIKTEDWIDSVGHGTACIGIILKKAPRSLIYSVKVLDRYLAAHVECLEEAIKWSVNNGSKIINLSLGTTNKNRLAVLKEVCDYAYENNVIIVSAENNAGEESYPAYFANVIGVTAGEIHKKHGYYFRQNHFIEIIAKGDRQKVAWIAPSFVYKSGSSFAAAHVTGIVALILEKFPNATLEQVKEILKANSLKNPPKLFNEKKYYLIGTQFDEKLKKIILKNDLKWIRKAILYPYNKEMHYFIRYKELLPFKVVGIVNEGWKGVTKKGFQDIPDDADTVILGHLDELSRTRRKDVLKEIVEFVISKNKNIYSLSPIIEKIYPEIYSLAKRRGLKIAYPSVTLEKFSQLKEIMTNKGTKFSRRTLVIGIFGTGPEQRQFITQLILRKRLQELGYRVGQVSTAHQSELFGFDLAFPNGYKSNVWLPVEMQIPYLRWAMSIIDSKDYDIIIVGEQLGIVPYDLNIFSRVYTWPAITFLWGTYPDAYILVVDITDSEEHIENNLNALKALGKGKTILLVINSQEKAPASGFEKRFNIPTINIGSKTGKDKLLKLVIDYLGLVNKNNSGFRSS